MADLNNNLNPIIKATRDPRIMVGGRIVQSTSLRIGSPIDMPSNPEPARQLQTDLSSIFTPPPPSQPTINPIQTTTNTPTIASPTPNNSFSELRNDTGKLSSFARELMQSFDIPPEQANRVASKLKAPKSIDPAVVILSALVIIFILFQAPFLLIFVVIAISNSINKRKQP